MLSKLKTRLNVGVTEEDGHILILVMILLLLGSVVIIPLLNFTGTGLKAGLVYETKAYELYAADAGVQDARWRIKYNHLETSLTSPPYSAYDYVTAWNYDLLNQVNTRDVNVTIENVWIPRNLAVPGQAEAEAIIDAGKLMVTGSSSGDSCTIKVTYNAGAQEDLRVESLGVWLPRGFSYVAGSSNLEEDIYAPYYALPVVEAHAGGQAISWTFNSVAFISFPGSDPEDSPIMAELTFQFSPNQPGSKPSVLAWITTSGVGDIPYSWDADTRVFKITSLAGNTTVEAYIAKEEMRQLSAAIAGDYCALGNSLMIDTNHDSHGIRDQLLASSDATVSSIPVDAEVGAAYLYWSAWRAEGSKQTVFSDNCSNFGNWISGSCWNIHSGDFRSHYSSGADSTRYLTLKNSIDLSSYAPGTVMVSWDQYETGTLESDDGLDFSFSADGGTTWGSNIQAFRNDIGSSEIRFSCVIPSQYLTSGFKLRFYLQSFGGDSEYCYLDDIAISVMSPDTSIIFKIDGHQAYFDGNGEPAQGSQPLTPDRSQVLPNYTGDDEPNGFSYACRKDVTELVRQFSAKAPDPATNHPGNGAYTVGSVTGDTGSEWSYAGWSLIIIYSSAETQGHQLFLYDTFMYAAHDTNIDFDDDGQPGGTISGFIVPDPIEGEVNAARLTVFVGEGDECYSGDYLKLNGTSLSNVQSPSNNVWNGKSPGLTADGVDIDTFDITWAGGLLEPGDTSAQIDLPTDVDNWNLVYIILSFRSETTTGGSLSYLIR